MSKTASITLILVGLGWMSQDITLTRNVELLRPFENADEARDFADSVRRELLTKPSVAVIAGLTHREIDFGDFSAVTDVRLIYKTEAYAESMGLVGSQETTTETREEIADFMNPDSYALSANDEEEYA